MTLLHQAAQKAVEALTREIMNMRGELEDDWSQAERGCYKLGHRDARHEAVALVNDAIAALESALQQQPEPVALERWGRAKSNGAVSLERMPDGYWTPWHIAQEALAASPSTTRQQEVGSGSDAMEAHRTNGLAWAVSCWEAEVKNRPLVNVHRRTLDDTWRQVIRYFGGDPDKLLGPNHDTLHMRAQEERAWKP